MSYGQTTTPVTWVEGEIPVQHTLKQRLRVVMTVLRASGVATVVVKSVIVSLEVQSVKSFTFLLLLVFMINGCSIFESGMSGEPSDGNNVVVQTDVDTLARWINLTLLPQPVNVRWIQQAQGANSRSVPGPTDYFVLAILYYEDSTAPLADQLGLSTRADVFVDDALVSEWMPSEISDRFVRTDGYLRFDGVAYTPGALILPPLTYGYVLFVDRYVVIYGGTS